MFLLNTCNIQPLECSPCSPTKKKHVHPGKLTCPLTKGTISIGNTSSNHQFSRDMLVFRGVFVQNDNLLLKAKLTIKGCDRHRSAKGYLGVPTHNCDRETSPFLIVKCFYKNPFFLQGKKGPEYTRLLVQLKSYLRRASFIIHHLSSLPKILLSRCKYLIKLKFNFYLHTKTLRDVQNLFVIKRVMQNCTEYLLIFINIRNHIFASLLSPSNRQHCTTIWYSHLSMECLNVFKTQLSSFGPAKWLSSLTDLL